MYSSKTKFGKLKVRFPTRHHHVLPLCHLVLTDVIPRQCLDIYARISSMDIQAQPRYGSFEDVYWTGAEAKPKLLSNKRTRINLILGGYLITVLGLVISRYRPPWTTVSQITYLTEQRKLK